MRGAVMNSERARNYFKECGLTYDCLNVYTLDLLSNMIQTEILKQRKEIPNTALVRMNPIKTTATQRKTGKYLSVDLTVKGVYFSSREAITFYEDGFINFCSWASGYHCIPFLEGFVKWCDEIKGNNDVQS